MIGTGARKAQDNKEDRMFELHDSLLVAYEVDIKHKEIVLEVEKGEKSKKVVFKEVLTHMFENILLYNIILQIEESKIAYFIKENKSELMQGQPYLWPMDYDSLENLEKYLVLNEYKYIQIYSSMGLCGWILAKDWNCI